MEDVKTIEVIAHDQYGDLCLSDSVGGINKTFKRSPQGRVEVYEVLDDGTKKLISKSNLVLYVGREWLAQRLVNLENTNVSSTKDEFLAWFGLGEGGVDPADPLDPIAPIITDTELYDRIMINTSDASSADYHVVSPGYPEEGYYKLPFDSIEFEQDALNDDSWLVLKVTVTVKTIDANGKQISEAGLFTAESRSGGYSGQFTIFARVTFPSIVKTADRRLVFSWYLYV